MQQSCQICTTVRLHYPQTKDTTRWLVSWMAGLLASNTTSLLLPTFANVPPTLLPPPPPQLAKGSVIIIWRLSGAQFEANIQTHSHFKWYIHTFILCTSMQSRVFRSCNASNLGMQYSCDNNNKNKTFTTQPSFAWIKHWKARAPAKDEGSDASRLLRMPSMPSDELYNNADKNT